MAMAGKGLVKLLEECGELGQIAAKKLAYFDTDVHPDGKGSMQVRLQEEMGDVLAIIDFVQEIWKLDTVAIEARRRRKRELFHTWHLDKTK